MAPRQALFDTPLAPYQPVHRCVELILVDDELDGDIAICDAAVPQAQALRAVQERTRAVARVPTSIQLPRTGRFTARTSDRLCQPLVTGRARPPKFGKTMTAAERKRLQKRQKPPYRNAIPASGHRLNPEDPATVAPLSRSIYSPEARFSSAMSAFSSATSACSVRRSVA